MRSAGAQALERMLTIRRFEEAVNKLFHDDHAFMTHFHLYIGQESTGVGLMEALGDGDKLATHHRNHGHILARGSDPKKALAEILGRETGLNKGAGGTLHMSDPDLGFISTSSIVGGSISLANGAAFALKQEGGDAIAVGLFGDGALEEGIAYESLNLAALYELPVLFVCENNSEGALGLRRRRLPHLRLRRQGPDHDPRRPSGSRSRPSTAATWRPSTSSPRRRSSIAGRARAPTSFTR